MRRLILCTGLLLTLAACAAEPVWAPDAEVAKYRYSDPGQPSITLITVINNHSGSGGHSALMINGSQRVIFDPAGTWWNPKAPERNDVHFGITPGMLDIYLDYHTRITWHTIVQTVPVSAEVAEMALHEVEANGAVRKAMCADTVSNVLHRTPGFQNIGVTLFPVKLMETFAAMPGVKTRDYYDTDPDINTLKLPPGQPDIVETQ